MRRFSLFLKILWVGAGVTILVLLLENLTTQGVLPVLRRNWIPILLASLLVLVGHGFRIQRTRSLLNAAGLNSSFKSQVAPLAVGLMFNTFVPMKLGEIIRALLISRSLKISKIYAISVVAVERLMDIAFAGFALSIALLFYGNESLWPWLFVSLAAGLASTLFLAALILVVKENRAVFKAIARISGSFNPELQYRVQHSTYSLIHGYQVFLNSKRESISYLANFLISWLFYLGGSLTLVLTLLNQNPLFLDVLSPFVAGGNLVSSPGIAEYSSSIGSFHNLTATANHGQALSINFAVATWLSLQGIVAVVGLIAFPFASKLARSNDVLGSEASSRIDRSAPQARNLSAFMELYFGRQNLARNFHAEDVRGESEVLGFFKGGSDAVTALIKKSGELRVRKTIDLANKDKLRGQFLWLEQHRDQAQIVSAIEERTTSSLYSIDLEFNSQAVPYFDYIHNNPLSLSEARLDEVLSLLSNRIWQISTEINGREALDAYLESRLFRRIENALAADNQLREIYEAESVVVNGVQYKNLPTLLNEILGSETGRNRLSCHRVNSRMHGDLTVDNILIDLETHLPILIDPSDDNEYRSTVLDYSRMHQSLAGGYEFCNSYQGQPDVYIDARKSQVEIRYLDFKSQAYEDLDRSLLVKARGILNSSEYESINFFTGVFFARMLDHRVKINPGTVPVYYAKSVMFLSQYLEGLK